jgi:predicted lipoprotein with Yx(FWY)xxD motif
VKTLLAALGLAVSAATLGAGSTAGAVAPSGASASEMEVLTLTVRQTRYGRILFDGKKRVLYGFTRDKRGGPSRCYGECAKAWPVYFAKGTLKAGNGVKQSMLGTTRRRDGRRHVTYNGWPLYYYAHEGPLEVSCQNVEGFGGLWLVVRPNGTLVRGG